MQLLMLVCILILAGCVTRPSSTVLSPVTLKEVSADKVTVLTATNRIFNGSSGGFENAHAENMTFERYDFSVPVERKNAVISYPTVKPDPSKQFIVLRRKQFQKDAFVQEAVRSAQSDGTIGIFVHGYNYTYQEALFRAAQIAADAKIPGAPILFAWPSAASVTGYVADRDAALASRNELNSLIEALSAPRPVKRIVLFGHSMGAFLVMETVRELRLQHRDDVIGKLVVVLAAPDIDVDVFRSQLKDIGTLLVPISVLVSKDDRALAASSLIAGERPRVGRVDVNDPIITEAAMKGRLRVIDISSVGGTDRLGHDRYASLAKFGTQFANFENGKRSTMSDVGAYVFDAAGAAVASPFRLAGQVFRSQ